MGNLKDEAKIHKMETKKIHRVKYTEQLPVMLTKEEMEDLKRLAEEMKGTRSQVVRLALNKFSSNTKKENDNNTE
jgi:DNA replication protein DnaD